MQSIESYAYPARTGRSSRFQESNLQLRTGYRVREPSIHGGAEEPEHTNLSGIRNVLVRTSPAFKAPVKHSACRLALPVALRRPPSVLLAPIGINYGRPEQCGLARIIPLSLYA
jgi:hypothetical protein